MKDGVKREDWIINVDLVEGQLVPMRMSCKERYDDHLISGFLFHQVGLFNSCFYHCDAICHKASQRLNELIQPQNFTTLNCELNRFLYVVHSSRCLLVEK